MVIAKKGKTNYEKKRKMLPEKINPLVRTNCGVHFHPPMPFRFSLPRIFYLTRYSYAYVITPCSARWVFRTRSYPKRCFVSDYNAGANYTFGIVIRVDCYIRLFIFFCDKNRHSWHHLHHFLFLIYENKLLHDFL